MKVGQKSGAVRARRMVLGAMLMAGAAAGPITATSASAQAGSAQAGAERQFDIPAEALADALVAFAAQSGLQVTTNGAALRGIRSPGVKGKFSAVQALSQILGGTGFTFRIAGSVVTLERAPQAADGAVQLGPVRVEGADGAGGLALASLTSDPAATEGLNSYTATGPSTTATGLAMTLRQTPQSVTVVTRQKMDDFGLETLSAVLEQTPGVTVTRQGSAIDFGSRGSTVNLRIDGLRQITTGWYYFSSTFYSLDEMANIDRVEVLKGSSGLINGDGNYGGTINLVRKKPTREFQASVGATVGRWDSYRADLDVSGPVNAAGTIRARGVAAWRDADTFRDNETQKNVLLYGTVDVDLTPDTLLNLGIDYKHQVQRGRGATTPIMAYDSDGNFIGLQPRSFNVGAPWAGFRQNAVNLFGTLDHRFDNGWSVRLQFGREQIKSPELLMGFLRNDYAGANLVAYRDMWQRNEHLTAEVKGPLHLLGRTHELIFGAGVSSARSRIERGSGQNVSLGDLGITYADGGADIPYPTNRANWTYSPESWHTKRSYVYAAGRFDLADPLKLVAGLRATNYDQHDVTASWWNYDMRERGVLTPFAGLTFDVTGTVSLYGSYARIFQAQSARDASGNTLPPLEGLTYELGAKGEFFDKRLNASLAYFWMKGDNEAEETGEMIPGTDEMAYRAVMGATRRGWEVELSGELAPGWQAQGSFVLNDSSLESSTNSPKHQLKLNSSYTLSSGPLAGLSFGGGTRWQSAISVRNDAAVLRQDSYWLFNLMARYQVDEHLSVGINADNLFDKRYFAGVTDFGDLHYTWGEPRNVKANVRYRF